MALSQTPTTPSFDELEAQLQLQLPDQWYVVASVALCALGDNDILCRLFHHVTQDTRVTSSEHRRRSARIREGLIKAVVAIGLPRVRHTVPTVMGGRG